MTLRRLATGRAWGPGSIPWWARGAVALCLTVVTLAVVPQAGAATTATFSISPADGPVAGGAEVTIEPPVAGGAVFTSVSAGRDHTAAIGVDGTTYAWGADNFGQLGDGGANAAQWRPVAVEVPPGVAFTSVSAGSYHSLAIGDDGNTYAWGDNYYGQLGDGTTMERSTPVEVSAPAGVTFVSVSAGGNHSVALGSDGRVYAWGHDYVGQLGDGAPENNMAAPVAVALPAGVTFTSVSAGFDHALALADDGAAYAWGDNYRGQLGNGSTLTEEFAPVHVTMPVGVTFTSVSAGGSISLAIGDDGKTYAWGYNVRGQVGDGSSSAHRSTPVEVALPAGVAFTSVSAGYDHALAVGDDGTVYAWGDDGDGQVGDGGTAASLFTPVAIDVPDSVTLVSVAGGDYHSVAIGDDGRAYAWGNNVAGQLGDDTTTGRTAPVGVFVPEVLLTGVSFGGSAGSNLTQVGTDWVVTTPAHAAGVVDVVLEWTAGGVVQAALTLSGGYEYGSAAPGAPPGDAADGGAQLAVTGAPSSSWLAALAGVTVLAGVALLRMGRRTRVRH